MTENKVKQDRYKSAFRLTRMLVRLITCLLILAAVAVQRNASLFGHDLTSVPARESTDTETNAPLRCDDDAVVVNTTTLAANIKGYGGAVPLKIRIKDDKIEAIEPLANSESNEFFDRVREELIPQWIGTPVQEVAAKNVDAVSGATLSSNAVNATVKKGVAYAVGNPLPDTGIASHNFKMSWRYAAVLLVILCAAIIPLFVKNKYYRYAQLALNVAVLGFWSGTFLSYELFINYLSNDFNLLLSLPVLLMLVIAFVFPYFGSYTHYCTWVCPLGSLQELCSRSVRYKLKLSPKTVNGLVVFQECLWFALIFIMMAGIWSDWINYELFKAFIFKSASVGVLIAAGVVVLMSFVVTRPYCRFICPTGCLFQITQNTNK